MNKPYVLIYALSVSLPASAGISNATAGDLFEPRNSHLTQSALAPGSRAFIVVDNETATMQNERYVGRATTTRLLFAPRQRRAIARWLKSAEGEQPAPQSQVRYRPGLTAPVR